MTIAIEDSRQVRRYSGRASLTARILPAVAAVAAITGLTALGLTSGSDTASRETRSPGMQAALDAAARPVDMRPVYVLYVLMDRQRALQVQRAENEVAAAAMNLDPMTADRQYSVLLFDDFTGLELDEAVRRIGNQAVAAGARFELIDERYQ